MPIALGTVFPVGFRAAEDSRLLRLTPHDYHAVAAEAPDVATEVGRLARHRMSGSRGLQGIAADPPPPRAIVVGHRWDVVLHRAAALPGPQPGHLQVGAARRPEAAEQWEGPLPAEDDLPAIRVVDGKTVVRPRARRVAELLGLGTEAARRSTTR